MVRALPDASIEVLCQSFHSPSPRQTLGYCRGRLCLIQATTELVDDSCQFILVGAVGHSSGVVHDQDMLAIKADFGGLIDSNHDENRVRLSPYSMQTKSTMWKIKKVWTDEF